MYISPVNQISPQYSPKFRGNNRRVYDAIRKQTFKTTTYFFREDMDWDSFIQFINYRYKDVPHVNIIDHACSNGQEPCSLVMKLLTNLGKGAEKFFPIIAKDFDKDNIECAKNGKCGIINYDIYKINNHTNGNFSTYLTPVPATNPQYHLAVIPKDIIKSHIDYMIGDIYNDIKTLPPKNTIFMCRNVWPYLRQEDMNHLIADLSKRLDKTSLLVIGDFDCAKSSIKDVLKNNNFKESPVRFVYEKKCD